MTECILFVYRWAFSNLSAEAHVPTPWYGQYLTHAHNHITPEVDL